MASTNDLSGKVITIDGVSYKLTKVSTGNNDKRTKAVITLKTPFGDMFSIFDRDDLRYGEGNHNVCGKVFNIRFVTEEEAENIKANSIDISDVDETDLSDFS